jgi:hypothetical protein
MDKCDPASASSDFTLQWSLSGLSAMAVAGVAMASAEYVGYAAVIAGSMGIGVLALALVRLYDGFDPRRVGTEASPTDGG